MPRKKLDKELEKRIKEWEKKGKKPEEITYGMLCDGFRSIGGIPDDFMSAEDPADRMKHWYERSNEDTGPWYLTGSGDSADYERKEDW